MHFMDPKMLVGMHVIGRNGVTLGVVEDVYVDLRSGRPQWAAIRSGLFGTEVSLIPLTGAQHDDWLLRIPYGTQEMKDAPHRTSGIMMSHKEEANLFRYYGVSYDSTGSPAGKPASAGRDVSGRTRGTGRTMLHRYAAPPTNQ